MYLNEVSQIYQHTTDCTSCRKMQIIFSNFGGARDRGGRKSKKTQMTSRWKNLRVESSGGRNPIILKQCCGSIEPVYLHNPEKNAYLQDFLSTVACVAFRDQTTFPVELSNPHCRSTFLQTRKSFWNGYQAVPRIQVDFTMLFTLFGFCWRLIEARSSMRRCSWMVVVVGNLPKIEERSTRRRFTIVKKGWQNSQSSLIFWCTNSKH
jgi:hypothetical protein